MQLREEGLHLKGKEIEGLMWFFQGTTCKSRWRRENNEKKKEKQTCVDPTCMCHHGRKNTPRRVKWYSRSMTNTIVGSCMHSSKVAKWLTRAWHAPSTFSFLFYFIYTKTKMLLGLNNNNKKNHYEITISKTKKIWMVKLMESLNYLFENEISIIPFIRGFGF